jgi:predicted Zn finger-like uncharacterized protein
MESVISCPSCHAQMKVLSEHSGRKVQCPQCKHVFLAPAGAAEAGVAPGLPPEAPRPGDEHVHVPRSPYAGERGAEGFADEGAEPPPKKLGSLAQAARGQQLRVARIILALLGVLMIGVAIYTYAAAENLIRDAVRQKFGPGAIPHPDDIKLVRTLSIVDMGLGGVYIVLAMIVYMYPVAVTVTGLVLYVTTQLIFAAAFGITALLQGLIFKILIVVGMAKAIQAAIAYEKERRAELQRRGEDRGEDYEPSSA